MKKCLYEIPIQFDPNPQFPYQNNPIPRWSVVIKIYRHYKLKSSPALLTFCYLNQIEAVKCKVYCEEFFLNEFFAQIKACSKPQKIEDLSYRIINLFSKNLDYASVQPEFL